jgi:hypothetical protein
MIKLSTCPSCQGFVPQDSATCPNCEAAAPTLELSAGRTLVHRVAKGLAAVGVGSAFALTLMACYGLPPCEPEEDQDGDGYGTAACSYEPDCDDGDPNIYPGAEDPLGDDIDQNCDGVDGELLIEDDAGPGDAGESDADAGG